MSAHTPGPWHWVGNRLEPVEQNYRQQAVSSILDREGSYGYVGRDHSDTTAELDADFVLIAACPDLLDAAIAAEAVLGRQKWLEGSTDPEAVALFKLRAAIAKATGRCPRCSEGLSVASEPYCAYSDCLWNNAAEATGETA